MAALPGTRSFWLFLSFVALVLEAFALFNQHVLGLEPCNECILIRVGVLGVALAGMLGAVAPRLLAMRLAAFTLMGAALSWALYRAYVLVDIVRMVAAGEVAGCKRFKGFPLGLPLAEWFPEIFEPRGRCGEIAGVFLGQSFAVWTLVGLGAAALGVLAVVAAAVAHRSRRA